MRLGWLALPLIIAVEACAPVRNYQEAARSLRFTLDRVEPRLQLAFPLERSRLALQITVTVENPSSVPFHLQGFEGEVRLESAGPSAQPSGRVAPLPLGHVALLRALDLPPGGRADLAVEVSFFYQDLRDQWEPLQAALRPGASGTWSLQGTLSLDAYGVPWRLPVTTRRSFGGER